MKTKIFYGLITFQILIILAMFGKAFYPLAVGKEVRFQVFPFDPRDMFRGNYVTLSYNFSALSLLQAQNHVKNLDDYRFGDALFLELKEVDGLQEPAGLWEKCPDGKDCLRVLKTSSYGDDSLKTVYLKAGIESYFANVKKAVSLEESLRNNDSVRVVVAVKLAANGAARIQTIDYEKVSKK